MRCRLHVLLQFLGLLVLTPVIATAEGPIELGSRRELFVDHYLIDRLDNAQLVLARPHDEGEVLKFDKPWEGPFCGYCTVIKDGDLYRVYYRGMATAGPGDGEDACTCIAESNDGVHWTKPNLGLYELHGTRDNNIILAHDPPSSSNFSPFLDTRPDVSLSERYKALGGGSPTGLTGFVSPDGIHWTRIQSEPVFNDQGWVFDSQNVSFWSPAEGCYALYFRKAAEDVRAIARATSPDFIHWSKPEPMVYSDAGGTVPRYHLYTNQTHPYFRAPHLLLSTAARFLPGRKVLSEKQAQAIGVHPDYFGDTSDGVLMTSRGGSQYDCTFTEGFLRPGIGYENWVSRTNYPALNVVQTGPTEMSLYANQNYGQPTAHLRRYSLRLDGFASVRAPDQGGELVTKPLKFTGKKLLINFATSAAGGVRVEFQEADGKPIPGFTLDDSVETIGNEIERAVAWKHGADVGTLAGKTVRLRFVLRDADLYALRFE